MRQNDDMDNIVADSFKDFRTKNKYCPARRFNHDIAYCAFQLGFRCEHKGYIVTVKEYDGVVPHYTCNYKKK